MSNAFLGACGLFVSLVITISGMSLLALWLTRRWPGRGRAPVVAAPGGPSVKVPAVGSATAVSICPICGSHLPGDSPEGLCPQCLMQCALKQPDLEAAGDDPQITTPVPRPFLPLAPAPAELAAHFPDLEILELLGQGGMGAVYKARQRKLDRLVAIKVLPPEWGRDPAFAERFAREARALARMNHPHIVSVHDFGEAGGHYFLIMEYVDGANLRQFLAAGRLQPWQALPIVNQVCDALQFAHEQGVVHRDIKPENILLDKRGRVKIADFGLVKLLTRSRAEYTLTASGQVMGTFDYMAPEQRLTPQTVDHRADIYSLGVVFYEMLTGELPVGRFTAPSEMASVDARLDEVVFRALERDPERRYQRISAVKMELESILRATEGVPVLTEAAQAGEPEKARSRPVRRFFLSAFSMFRPGPVPARPKKDLPPPLPQQHRRKRPSKWVTFLIVAGGVAMIVFVIVINGGRLQVGFPDTSDTQPQGLTFELHDDLTKTASLTRTQAEDVKKILLAADQEYLEIERSHTKSQSVGTPNGRQVEITINPFPDEIKQLEERVWARLDAIAPERQFGHDQLKKQLPQRGSLFAFGMVETRITITKESTGWYNWTVEKGPKIGTVMPVNVVPLINKEEGNGLTLPRRYKRFWRED